jgi:hypothetical protein
MITLSEYLGFIFVEITNARVMADQESARIAELYSQNPMLEKFSVPRFKIPEMELSIPVVVSGAKFTNTLLFNDNVNNFNGQITNEIVIAIKKLQIKKGKINLDFNVIKDPVIFKPIDLKVPKRPIITSDSPNDIKVQEAVDTDILEFYNAISESNHLDKPEELVTLHYAKIFNARFEDKKLIKDYKENYPNNELFLESLANIQKYIKDKTIVSKTKIENLLVSPETNIINEEANDLSVFNIKAKITEEGIFVKTVRDKNTDKIISADVNFE